MPLRPPPHSPDVLPLLLGRLYRAKRLDDTSRLMIRVWCPMCQGAHMHSWNPECGLVGMGHRAPHCPLGSPNHPAGYRVALDPAFDRESRQLLKSFTGEDYP